MKFVGITAHLEKPQVPRVVGALLRQLKRLRQPFLLERRLAERIGRSGGVDMAEIARRCRLLVVLGGDGTVLRAAREVHPHPISLLPVNLGTLGFLAAVLPRDLARAIRLTLDGKGRIVQHTTLEVAVQRGGKTGGKMIALNDAVISRGTVSRVAELELRVDGQFLNSYICDGVIVSTATGSTAYSLSAGGPIVVPEARVLTITPICPHTLTNRSVIVGDRSVVEARIVRQPDELFLNLDGQRMIQLNTHDCVRAGLGAYKVRIVTLAGGSFFELLRKKLHWTGSNI